jgi:exosome complex RNA-binding protein Rrp4
MAGLLLPGESCALPPAGHSISPSLLVNPTHLTAQTCGTPVTTASATLHPHHILPAGTHLIALVSQQNQSSYTLAVPNLPASHSFVLPLDAFPGASRRHRPNLTPDAPVLVRTLNDSTSDVVNCTCVFSGDSDWASGQVVLGELKAGLLIPLQRDVSLSDLLPPYDTLKFVTKTLGPYEMAVGANGVVWVKGNERELNWLLRKWRGGIISDKDVKDAKIRFNVQK